LLDSALVTCSLQKKNHPAALLAIVVRSLLQILAVVALRAAAVFVSPDGLQSRTAAASAARNYLQVLAAPNQQVAAAAVSPGYSAGAARA
jgi:hypothetical protein